MVTDIIKCNSACVFRDWNLAIIFIFAVLELWLTQLDKL